MKIVFLTHPDFEGHQSMPRFTNMLADGMKKRGHYIEVWKPEANLFNLSTHKFLSKWLGYIDQFLIFPKTVRKKILENDVSTLYVLIDHALGPWMPLVYDKPHVVHCHDFLAQLSAQGFIKNNPVSITGKTYQSFIRRGYSKAKNFITVSEKTKVDLLQFLEQVPVICEVVYNGLNQKFKPLDKNEAKKTLIKITGVTLSNGFILHVGGNQWYKNRLGVIDIYASWRRNYKRLVPLLLIGEKASPELEQKKLSSGFSNDIYFLDSMSDEGVRMAYSCASMLLFPSIAEGFGWPIAEAMASGCPVITTNQTPMTEVAGDAALLIPLMPDTLNELNIWADDAAAKVESFFNLSITEYDDIIKAGIINSKRFDTEIALDKIEKIYLTISGN